MASLGGAGESVAVVVGAGELGTATAALPAGTGVHGDGGRSHPAPVSGAVVPAYGA